MKRKKILFCVESLDMNGAMKSLIALLRALSREKYEITLFICSHQGVLMKEIPSDIKILKENVVYAVFRLPFGAGLKCALLNNRFDLILLRCCVPILRFLRLPALRFWFARPFIEGEWDVAIAYADGFIAEVVSERVHAKKKFLWIHTDYERCPEHHSTAKAFQKTQGAVSVSKDSIKAFKFWFSKHMCTEYTSNIHVVYNIIDRAELLKKTREDVEFPPKKRAYRFVTVGRVTLPKGPLLIPRIAEELVKRNADFEWYIVGAGDLLEKCRILVQQLELEHCVYFIGERENPFPLLQSADIVVQPSVWEGWGMTISEALLLKKPIVATNLSVFMEQIEHGENGLLVPFDAVEFANAIIQLTNNPDLTRKMACYSKEYPFSIKNVCQQFDELINS